MLEIRIYNDKQSEVMRFPAGPVEIGREDARTLPRVKVREDVYTSRHQALVEELDADHVRLTNIAEGPSRLYLTVDGVPGELLSGQRIAAELPLRFSCGRTVVEVRRVQPGDSDPELYQTIQRSVIATSLRDFTGAGGATAPSADQLLEWFEALVRIQRSAAGTRHFLFDAARAVVELIGLDRSCIVLRQEDEWVVSQSYAVGESDADQISRRWLDRMLMKRETVYQGLEQLPGDASLKGIEAAVAAPLRDARGEIVGALYGSRDNRRGGKPTGVTPLEARFVQVLAEMVTAGMLRASREEDTARLRVRFDEFLSRDLAAALDRDPGLLELRDREITLMFLDLRGFSSLAEKMDTETAYGFLSRCLDEFTDVVLQNHGLIIDYYGDGFAAMWNAPNEQPQHAELAVNSAIEINARLPGINAGFCAELQSPVRVGIGIHTAVAQLGNAGSALRVKYGPRGPAVNLASRVEGANKHFGTSCLITGETRAKLPNTIALRRICHCCLAGLKQPVELYELVLTCDIVGGASLFERYEQALQCYELGHYARCIELCGTTISQIQDKPTLWLLSHATRRLQSPLEPPDPVFRFDVK